MIKKAFSILTSIACIAFFQVSFLGWAAGYDSFLQML